MTRFWMAGALLVLTLALGCDDDLADFEGMYTLNLTNGDNGCDFDNWTVGETSMNIPVTISQDGGDVTALFEGLAGGFLNLVLGDDTFEGAASGNDLDLTLFGTRSATEGNCTWTVNAVMDAKLRGDLLEGEIRYEVATNGNPDCSAIEECATVQAFNGTRPPQ